MQHIKYPSVERLDKFVAFLTESSEIIIQEKADGSNVGVTVEDDFQWHVQSRNNVIDPNAAQMFSKVFDYLYSNISEFLVDQNLIYYGELLSTNKIKYASEVPFLVFDIYDYVNDKWLSWEEVQVECDRVGFKTIPILYVGPWQGVEHVEGFLSDSAIDSTKRMEGVVVKSRNVTGFYHDKETKERGEFVIPYLLGKVVTDEYKELSKSKTSLKKADEPIKEIAATFVTPARIDKAIQREVEAGVARQDIQIHKLVSSVAQDIHKEELDTIKEYLFKAYRKDLHREIAQQVVAQVPV